MSKQLNCIWGLGWMLQQWPTLRWLMEWSTSDQVCALLYLAMSLKLLYNVINRLLLISDTFWHVPLITGVRGAITLAGTCSNCLSLQNDKKQHVFGHIVVNFTGIKLLTEIFCIFVFIYFKTTPHPPMDPLRTQTPMDCHIPQGSVRTPLGIPALDPRYQCSSCQSSLRHCAVSAPNKWREMSFGTRVLMQVTGSPVARRIRAYQ